MENIFKQSKRLIKIIFDTEFRSLEKFESILPEDIEGISAYEISSESVESKPLDLWRLEVYIGDDYSPETIKELIKEFAENSDLKIIGELSIERIEEKDWIAENQKNIKPLLIDKYFVANKDQIDQCSAEHTPICIDVVRAFGTGDHETTSSCVKLIDKMKELDIKAIFEIGTGTGILSFVAEKVWPEASISACDIDGVSVHVAKQNAQLNESQVNFFQNNEDDFKIQPDTPKEFDLIVGNILARPLIDLSARIKKISGGCGRVVLSGFLKNQRQDVLSAYEKSGFTLEDEIEKNNWISLLLKVKDN